MASVATPLVRARAQACAVKDRHAVSHCAALRREASFRRITAVRLPEERRQFSNFAGDSASAETSARRHAHHHGRSASSIDASPRKVDGFLTRLAILCARKASLESPLWLHVKSRQ